MLSVRAGEGRAFEAAFAEDHEVGFRQSPQYLAWKRLLHHFYDPFPVVEHFELVEPQPASDALRPTGSAGG